MPEKQKSLHWDERQHTTSKIKAGAEPFDEGWPRGRDPTTEFTLITWHGERVVARLDLSQQYKADGISWRTLSGECFHKHQVIAWCEN